MLQGDISFAKVYAVFISSTEPYYMYCRGLLITEVLRSVGKNH